MRNWGGVFVAVKKKERRKFVREEKSCFEDDLPSL